MEVEEYIYLKYYEMRSILEDKAITRIQGRPVVIIYSSQFTEEFLKQFFAYSFSFLSKIVLEKSGKYYLLCDKYEKECIEPFKGLVSVTDDIKNDVNTLIAYSLKNHG